MKYKLLILLTFIPMMALSGVRANYDLSKEVRINIPFQTDKRDVLYSINNALSYIEKGLSSSNLSDLQSFARKANSAAKDAESYADDIQNEEVEWYCHKGATNARNAESESNIKNAKSYLEIAQKALLEAKKEL